MCKLYMTVDELINNHLTVDVSGDGAGGSIARVERLDITSYGKTGNEVMENIKHDILNLHEDFIHSNHSKFSDHWLNIRSWLLDITGGELILIDKVTDFFVKLLKVENDDEKFDVLEEQVTIKVINMFLRRMEVKGISQQDISDITNYKKSYVDDVFSIDKPLTFNFIVRMEEILDMKLDIAMREKNERH